MMILLLITMLLSVGILTINPSEAFAHGTEKHDKTSAADIQMKKLHAMMPMFSMASAELESAIEKGDATAAKTQADRILAAVPGLKMSKPHKNVKQRTKFVGLATQLQETVAATADLANKGDIAGAKAAFKKVEETCAACHAKFRD
jgi:soluble cytochrome b562